MHRRIFLRNTGIFTAGGLMLQKTAFADVFKFADYKVTMLRNNVGVFTERGGTIGFYLSKEGNLVIDAQFPDTAPHVIEEVKQRNPGALRMLINTHHHGDHTAGNIAFKGIAEKVLAHKNSLKNQKAVAEKNNNLDKQLLPDSTFEDEVKLKFGDEKIKGYYFGPAHTDGDGIYHFQDANIMHVGDLMFNKRHPFVDRSAGANMENWMRVLDEIVKEGDKDTLYIFGHSLNAGEETGSAEDLKKFRDYLGRVLAFAEGEFKKGVTKEAFVKNTSIPGETEWTGAGIERPLTAAYEEVQQKHQ